MAVVLLGGVTGFGGGVRVEFTRFAGFTGFFRMGFAEAAGIIGFNRINPVDFRGMGMRFRSRLERFGHGGNGVAFLGRRGGRGRKLVGSGARTPAAATPPATPAVDGATPGGRQIQIRLFVWHKFLREDGGLADKCNGELRLNHAYFLTNRASEAV